MGTAGATLDDTTRRGLRTIVADEDPDALAAAAGMLRSLGHEVASLAIGPEAAVERVAAEGPDVALVVVHRDAEQALEIIAELAQLTATPVVALLEGGEAEVIGGAADRGVDAVAWPITPGAVQAAIDVAVRRHAERRRLDDEVAQLRGALERRAVIERAKGVLMERHRVDERAAFALLRDQARSTNRTVLGLAEALLEGHPLLPGRHDG